MAHVLLMTMHLTTARSRHYSDVTSATSFSGACCDKATIVVVRSSYWLSYVRHSLVFDALSTGISLMYDEVLYPEFRSVNWCLAHG